jgi:hypothetical protein
METKKHEKGDMISYSLLSLLSVTVFALVHLFAGRTTTLCETHKARLLSAGSGIAIAYVFIDLLPKLAKNEELVKTSLEGFFTYFERHVYVFALAGYVLFLLVGQSRTFLAQKRAYLLSLASYGLFNFFVGYAVVDKDDPDVKPLFLFTLAMALHYFSSDFTLSKEHGISYQKVGKWFLVFSLYLGWLAGLYWSLSATGVALVCAFIAGGVIMNVTRHEVPSDNPKSTLYFLFCALLYTAILLKIGS